MKAAIEAMAKAGRAAGVHQVSFILERADFDRLVAELTVLYGHPASAGLYVYINTCNGPTMVRASH